MQSIKFLLPPLNKNGTFNYKHKDFKGKKSGIYIVGVKILVNSPIQFDDCGKESSLKIEKFCPLYVGKSEDMAKRIKGHQEINNYKGELNYNKELFDLDTKGNASILYHSIKQLIDLRKLNKKRHSQKNDIPLRQVPNCILCGQEKEMFQHLIEKENTLLWFPNPDFFNLKIDSDKWKSAYCYHNAGHYTHLKSVDDDLNNKQTKWLLDKIKKTKEIIENKFWFAYYILDENHIDIINKEFPGKNKKQNKTRTLHCIEDNTFEALRSLNISTYAKATSNKKIFCIDFSEIQNDLVNMNGVPYPKKMMI
jgi:hypothetical protein